MKLVDSHAHITSDILYPEVETLIQRAEEAGIKAIINICTDKKTLERGLKLQEKYPGYIFLAASTTPHDAHTEGEAIFPLMAQAAREKRLVAVGETGLEYHYYPETKEIQQALLIRYFHLAVECQLPVVIHCRDAFQDLLSIIDQEYKGCPGVLHCFTGNEHDAQGLLERGWLLSFSGIVTYKKSEDLRAIIKKVPLDRLLIETDAPYLSPQKKRGETNEPAFLTYTAQLIAEELNLSVDTLAQQTAINAGQFFNLTL